MTPALTHQSPSVRVLICSGVQAHRRLLDLAAPGEDAREIGYGALEADFEGNARLPVEEVAGARDIGAALRRIVDRQRAALDLRARAEHRDDLFGQLADRRLDRIAEIDRPGHVIRSGHQAQEALDEIVDEAEGARLLA